MTGKIAFSTMQRGEPVAAACHHFAVNDVTNGLDCLFKGNELLLYYIIISQSR